MRQHWSCIFNEIQFRIVSSILCYICSASIVALPVKNLQSPQLITLLNSNVKTQELGHRLPCILNTLRSRQNGRRFPDDIFKYIFLYENVWISLKISLKFIPKVLINNIPSLVQIMAWRQPGDKPLYEPMMGNSLTHICVTWPQWVNTLRHEQNGHHLADDIFKCIFVNEKVWISIKISLKFVPYSPVNNKPTLVPLIAWFYTDT